LEKIAREMDNEENPNSRGATSTILRTNNVISSCYKAVLVVHGTKRTKTNISSEV